MKIFSFVREGRIDCGLVTDDNTVAPFAYHGELANIKPERRLFHLLELDSKRRIQILEEMDGAPTIEMNEAKS